MLIAFTPTLNGLFGGGNEQLQKGAPSLLVNGETLYELDVARAQQNPPFNQGFQGEVADDLNILLVDSLVQNTILNQAASKIKVSDGDVRAKVTEFREQQGVAGSRNDQAYLSLISQYGFNDQTFRDYWRQRVKVEKFQEDLTKDVSVSDAEIEAFYTINKDNYQSEEKIKARLIVLDDPNKADDILAKAKAGEDFGTLAKDNSLERADRNGALGAAEGSTDPQAVGRAALPTEVVNAAFALQAAGLTDVISASEKFYIVSVEEFIAAAPEALETIKDKVQTEALDAKKAGVLEQSYKDLRTKAQVSIPEGSTLTFDDVAVAKVGDTEIKRSELAQAVYFSPQIQQSLSPGLEQIVTGIFKPSYLEQLIDNEVAYQGSKDITDATFFGTKGLVAQQAKQFVSRDAFATPEEIQKYYDDNVARYTDPASAVVNRVNFETQEAASKFREAMLASGELQATAEANAGIVVDLGTVSPGSLAPELDDALFKTNAFDKIADSEDEVSDVLVIQEVVEEAITEESTDEAVSTEESTDTSEEATTEEPTSEEVAATEETSTEATTEQTTGEETTATTDEVTEPKTKDVYVVLVGTRTAERVRPFEEVKAQVEETVLGEKRGELQKTWLDGLKEKIKVENLLASATAATTPETPDATFETTPLDTAPIDAAPTDTAPTEETPAEETQPEGQVEEGSLEEVAEAATGAVTETAENAGEAIAETAGSATEAVTEAAETVTEAASETVENAEEAVTEAVENTTEAVTEVAENATEAAGEAVENATEAATEAIEETTEAVTEATETTTEEAAEEPAATSGSITGGIGTSFNFSAMESQAKDLSVKVRDLIGRSDLSDDEQKDLKKLQTSLATAQSNIARLSGAQSSYTVKEGDTLDSIAQQFLGGADQSAKILEANDYILEDAESLFPGAVLIIPKQ